MQYQASEQGIQDRHKIFTWLKNTRTRQLNSHQLGTASYCRILAKLQRSFAKLILAKKAHFEVGARKFNWILHIKMVK